MNTLKMRSLFESRSKETNGRWRFLTEMRHALGLCDKEGNSYRDAAGNRVLKDAKLKAEQLSVAELAEAVVGPTWKAIYNPENGTINQYTIARGLMESNNPGDTRALIESTGFGLDPGAFLNINT
jgi:hypothetical protein